MLIGADDVEAGKPSPEGYLKAAQRLGVDARRCVVLEDTPAGVQAGRAAGAKVIGLTTTYSTLPDCDVLVSDLQALRPERPLDDWALRLAIDGSRRQSLRQ